MNPRAGDPGDEATVHIPRGAAQDDEATVSIPRPAPSPSTPSPSTPSQNIPSQNIPSPNIAALLVAVGIGTLVAVGLGVYGGLHQGANYAVSVGGFSSASAAKSWLATIAFVLALVQLFSALVMYGRIPVTAPSWIGTLHRWSGRVAVLVSVPVAVHCLYAIGFQLGQPRVLAHSLLGCFFYGAFVTKMLLLPRKGLPGWSLPVFGGAVFTALTGLWLTSAVYFFATTGLTL